MVPQPQRALGSESGGLDWDPGSRDLGPGVQPPRLPAHLENEQLERVSGDVPPVLCALLGPESPLGFLPHPAALFCSSFCLEKAQDVYL